MQAYTVHLPPVPSRQEQLSRAVFVRDGFHLVALLAPPVWLLWYRQWLGLALYVSALIILDFSADFASYWSLSIINTLFGIGIALEASTLRRWRLSARNWRMAGVVTGYDLQDAEERFFAGLTDDTPAPTASDRVPSGAPSHSPIRGAGASVPSIIGYQQ